MSATPELTLRERNKLNAMRHVQAQAYDLFCAKSFDDVTIKEIAQASGVSEITIYRHFGTKENLVLWDDSINTVGPALLESLASQPPAAAIKEVAITVLAPRYNTELQLGLTKIAFATPAIVAASVTHDQETVSQLVLAITQINPDFDPVAAQVIAMTCMTLVTTALHLWQANDGQRPLGQIIAECFDVIEHHWA